MSYIPAPPPSKPEALGLYLQNELQVIATLLEALQEGQIQERYVAPSKPQNGQLVYADGTSWNPSSGRGLYHYRSGTGWVFIG